jgi:capsular polysaccharide biosynthesis protein
MPELKDVFGQIHKFFESYSVRIPAFEVYELPAACLFTDREEIYSADKDLILDYTTQKENPIIGRHLYFNRVVKIKGTVMHLGLNGLECNYGHWLVECLGRLYLLKKANIFPDYFVVSDLPWQREWLSMLGIRTEQIITTRKRKFIQADNLLITTLINNWKEVFYRQDQAYPSFQKIWLPSWIGCLYREHFPPNETSNRKIYITRSNFRRRKIINEIELWPILQRHGYNIIAPEKLEIRKQIEIFQSAKSICAVLGAASTNMLFSKPETKILEIYSDDYLDAHHRILARVLNMDYNYMIGRSMPSSDGNCQCSDIYVDPELFEYALARLE